MADVQSLEIERLSPAIGAEIKGLDVSKPLNDATVAALRAAWLEHQVLVFRGQDLSEDDQARFARHFGPVADNSRPVDTRPQADYNPAVLLITNIRKDGKKIGSLADGELQFHSDSAFLEKPLLATVLYGVTIPSHGGTTMFSNMYMAYDAVPDDIKKKLADAKGFNIYDYDTMVKTKRANRDSGSHWAVHPVFRTHPETGRKALYVNRLMTEEIVGLPPAESDELLAQLFEIVERREFIYEHFWKPGDLLMWDNRCVQHARTDFPADEVRLMKRIAVQGDVPF